jgi:methionine-rich copper-binding protein CopC
MKRSMTILICLSLLASMITVFGPLTEGSAPVSEKILQTASPDPANQTIDVPTNTPYRITFSESMAHLGIVSISPTPPIQGTWAWNTTSLCYNYTGMTWAEQTTYWVNLSGFFTVGMQPLLAPYQFWFTTADETSPDLTSTTPADNAIDVTIGQDIVLTFDEAMDTSSLTYTCAPDPGGWPAMGPALWSAGDTVCTLTHNNFAGETVYTFDVTAATDVAGNPFTAGVPDPFTFTTADITDPSLTATTPVDTATGVAIGQNIVLTFDEAMDTSSLTYTCAPDPGGWPVMGPALWSVGDTVCTLTHNNFAGETVYTFDVTAATDVAGNPFTAGVPDPFTFTTADISSPSLSATIPVNQTTDVPTNTQYQLQFSEVMNTGLGTCSVQPAPPVGGAWAWDGTSRWYNYTGVTWAEVTTYWVNLTGFEDPAGNPLVGPKVFWFTTADETPPTAIPTPADGATGVAVDIGTYTITFNEPMQAVGTLATDTIPSGAWGWTDTTHYEKTGIAALADVTTYDVVLNLDFLDLAGNPVAGDVTFEFTTAGDSILPDVYNLTWVPTDYISVNNPIQVDFKVNETNLKQVGALIAKRVGGNAALDNYTGIIEYTNASTTVDLTKDQSKADEYNVTMEWDTTCPAIINVTIGGYLSNGNDTMEYTDTDYWANATGVRFIGLPVYFTNDTYPNSVKAYLMFSNTGTFIGLYNETGAEQWFNATDLANATYANGTVQLRMDIFSISKATGTLVGEAEVAFGQVFDLVDVEFVIDEVVPSGNYYVVAWGEDQSDQNGYNMSTAFEVDNTPPAIMLDSPVNGSLIQNVTDIMLTVTDDNLALVTYSINGAAPINLTAPFDIDTADWPDGNYTFVVNATDAANNMATATYVFTLDSTMPRIILNSPENESRITSGIPIDFTITDVYLTTVNYSIDGGAAQNFTTDFIVDTTGWTEGTHTVTVNALDEAGNLATETFEFTVDDTDPTVVSVVPADDAEDVALDTTIVITFSEAMNNLSVQVGFTISPGIVGPTYSWNTDGRVVTITWPADLAQNTEYTITVGVEAMDVAGNGLVSVFTSSFTTVLDTDGDGTPDATDTDDDNDGFLDTWEEFLGTSTTDATDTPTDTDGDGIPDGDANNTQTWMDTDDDGDGVLDADDADPLDPEVGAEDGGSDYTMIIVIVIIVVIVVVAVAVMMMRKPPTPKPSPKEEAEPPTEEESLPEEEEDLSGETDESEIA